MYPPQIKFIEFYHNLHSFVAILRSLRFTHFWVKFGCQNPHLCKLFEKFHVWLNISTADSELLFALFVFSGATILQWCEWCSRGQYCWFSRQSIACYYSLFTVYLISAVNKHTVLGGKSRIWETRNLSTAANSSTNIYIFFFCRRCQRDW